MRHVLSLGALLALSPVAVSQVLVIESWSAGVSHPAGVAHDPITNEVWVVDSIADMIHSFDTSGNAITSFPAPPGSSVGIAIDPVTGNLWVCEETEIVYEYDRLGNPTGVQWSARPSVIDASGITIDPLSRTALIVNDSGALIGEFDLLTGTPIGTISVAAAGSVDGDGVAYDPLTQTIYLAEDTGDQLIQVDRTGALIRTISTLGLLNVVPNTPIDISPEGIDIDTVGGAVWIVGGNTLGGARTASQLFGVLGPSAGGLVASYGSGCADSGGGVPALGVSDLLQIGGAFDLAVQTTVATGSTAQAFFMLDVARVQINLGFLGAPACDLLALPGIAQIGPLPLNGNRRAGVTLVLGNDPGLQGVVFDWQAVVFPDVHAGVISTSNALETTIQ